jgi:hypothetical protein
MIPILRGMTKGMTRSGGRRNNFVLPVGILVGLLLIGQAFWLSRNNHLFVPFEVSRIDCVECARIGTVRDPENPSIRRMCQACFGVGYHQVRRFDEQDVLCAACGGAGRVDEDGTWRTCRRCDGRGLHRINDWQEMVDVIDLDDLAIIPENGVEGTPVTPAPESAPAVENPEPLNP